MAHAEIAAELFVSVNTVKTQVRSIYTKLGARGRKDAIARAEALGLL
jgi:LuxR family maltose regulon positive regulatory protein